MPLTGGVHTRGLQHPSSSPAQILSCIAKLQAQSVSADLDFTSNGHAQAQQMDD